MLARIEERLDYLGLSARKASLKAGLGIGTIPNIKSGKTPSAERLKQLARVLEVPVAYLQGDTDEVGLEDEPADYEHTPHGYVSVPSLDVRAGMGGGGDGEEDFMGPPALMPSDLIEGELRGEAQDFLSLEVEGTSMSPELESGDRVLVDRRKTNPTQPGIFALFDGFGIVCKLVQRVHNSDPPALKIISRDKDISPYEVTIDEAQIIGRVVWFARKI